MSCFSRCVLVLAAVGFAAFVAPVEAAEPYKGFQSGDILVRGRALAVMPAVTSTVKPIGGQVSASTSFEPEVDVTYFFTPNIAAELIAAVTRHHLKDRGSSLGNVDLGRTTMLPPTLTAQYHFQPAEAFKPYVGAGVNYTVFFDSETPAGGVVNRIAYQNSFGTVIQAGFDYHIQGNWFLNVDVKHVFLETKAKINGGAVNAYVSLDPTIAGIGIGYKF